MADLALKQQNLAFLKDKHAYEMEIGRHQEARATQAQIFGQEMDISQARFAIDQANRALEERRQDRLQAVNRDISQAAMDPGDRGMYASLRLANSGWGQDVAGDMRTPESLAPLENMLRLRSDLTTPAEQIQYTGPTSPSGINLGALTQSPQGTMQAGPPDLTPGYTTPGVVEGGQPPLPGPVNLNADEIMAGAQWAPTQGTYGDPTAGINLQALMGPDNDLPLKDKGGIEDEAFIAGEKGPELVMPLADGRTRVFNEEQMGALGINLKNIVKMAAGGIFDLPNDAFADTDRNLATDFLTRSTQIAKQNTPWQGMAIPGPTFASSPGFDPIVAQLMAAINAQETGLPAAAYLRQAALRRPAGVGEAPIRRTA